MAVISDTSICNSALSKLGASRILSLNDDSKEGRLCKEQYPKLRDDLLMSHPWNFAIGRKELAEVTTYTPPYEYENAFMIPLNCLRIISTDLNFESSIREIPWDVETDPDTGDRLLLTNASSVAIRFMISVGEARFSKNFAEALAWVCAADWAYNLTQSSTLTQLTEGKAEKKIREIRSYDAQESSLKQVQADEWNLARL